MVFSFAFVCFYLFSLVFSFAFVCFYLFSLVFSFAFVCFYLFSLNKSSLSYEPALVAQLVATGLCSNLQALCLRG
jgi:hypothetical protein